MNDWLSIERPSRYEGREWNIIAKPQEVTCRLLMAFPNTYEIGMSHLGLRILYDLINGKPDLAMERVFTPWPDRESQMIAHGETLSSLETQRPARSFDLLGFSLQSELDFTNILTMLNLAGMKIRAGERDLDVPLVIAGGPVAFNPEPLSRFIDLFLLGDAEEQLPALMYRLADLKNAGMKKDKILRELAKLTGIYVPALHETLIDADTGLEVLVAPEGKIPFTPKAMVADLDAFPFPRKMLVPYCDIVHDRVSIEISRGCSRGCRFCQAGVIYMPERQRSPQSVVDSVVGMLESTGYNDVSLSALTPNDYKGLRPLVGSLMQRFQKEGVAMSFASLSPSRMDAELLRMVKEVRKTGLTIAPEAGTQRLRDVINKGITEEDVLTTAREAFDLGWKLIKLYFMIGQPTETDEDVLGIVELAKKVAGLGRGITVKIGCSNFVPKSHTPFQWVAMDSAEELRRKQRMLREAARGTRITLSFHDIEESILEGVLSRGDRRAGELIERAWELGCRFDGWREHLRYDLWEQAFAETGVHPDFYNHRLLVPYGRLPWDHIDSGVRPDFLKEEYQLALGAQVRIRCAPKNCPRCRACPPALLKEKWGPQPDGFAVDTPPSTLVTTGEGTYYRLRFRKGGPLRSLGHLDLVRLVSRVFRRAGVTVALTQGFHPQPKFAFALALPLGQEGMNEYLDTQLIDPPAEDELLSRLNAESPEGLVFNGVRPLGAGKESLSAELVAADYAVRRLDGGSFTENAVARFLALNELTWKRTHKGKEKNFNLRGMVLAMQNSETGDDLRLRLSLRGNLLAKPSEVVQAAFDLPADRIEVVREQLYISRDGRLQPPI